MPALLIWLIRLIGIAYVARRALRGGQRMPDATTVRQRARAGSFQLPEIPFDLAGAGREARSAIGEALHATFALRRREVLVLVVGALILAAIAFPVLASTR